MPEYPTQSLENELQRGMAQVEKKIPQGRMRPWILQAATASAACIDTAELIASDLWGLGFLKLSRSISAPRGKDQTRPEAPQKSYDRCVTVT